MILIVPKSIHVLLAYAMINRSNLMKTVYPDSSHILVKPISLDLGFTNFSASRRMRLTSEPIFVGLSFFSFIYPWGVHIPTCTYKTLSCKFQPDVLLLPCANRNIQDGVQDGCRKVILSIYLISQQPVKVEIQTKCGNVTCVWSLMHIHFVGLDE